MTSGTEEKLLQEVQALKWTCIGLILITLAMLLYAMVTISRVTVDVYDKVTELRVMVEGIDARMKVHRKPVPQVSSEKAAPEAANDAASDAQPAQEPGNPTNKEQ